MLSVCQVVAYHATYVGPETVADAMYIVRRCSRICEMGVELSRTLGYQSGVAQRGQITREKRQRFPVHSKHVVVFSV